MVNRMSKDTIYRQAAIDALSCENPEDYCYSCIHVEMCSWYPTEGCEFRQLPSAEPEPLTDKEQKIFLAAMGREREVCKQVDEEWRDYREPYEDSLVSVCNEIERKVKGALWTI